MTEPDLPEYESETNEISLSAIQNLAELFAGNENFEAPYSLGKTDSSIFNQYEKCMYIFFMS